MSILRRTWVKYQQLLITHPWKTQTIGTGIVINEIPFLDRFEETSPHSNHLSEVMSSKNPKLNCCEISLNPFMSPPRFTKTLTINSPILPTAELCLLERLTQETKKTKTVVWD